MAKRKITDIVENILSEYMKEEGYELYNMEFVKEGKDWFLRVYADLSEGNDIDDSGERRYISTEDCEKISRFLSDKLDEADPIEQNYYLEVSSPGMDRPLLKPDHYRRYIGSDVEIRLYRGMEGRKQINGILEDFQESETGGKVIVKDYEDKKWELQLEDISKARLAVIF